MTSPALEVRSLLHEARATLQAGADVRDRLHSPAEDQQLPTGSVEDGARVLRAIDLMDESVSRSLGRLTEIHGRLPALPPDKDREFSELEAAGEQLLVEGRHIREQLYQEIAALVPDQAWFWTRAWQAGEREVDANQAAGRATFYVNEDELEAAFAAIDSELDAGAHVRG